jgi:hypothetical protein
MRLTEGELGDLHMVAKRSSMKRWRLAIEEIRERRAADLKPDEKLRLTYAREVIRDSMIARHSSHDEACARAIAILDRLIASKP